MVPLQLRITTHAIDRWAEKVSADTAPRLPESLILKMFRNAPDGARKRLAVGGMEYILKRDRGCVYVVTLYPREKPPKLSKGCRRK